MSSMMKKVLLVIGLVTILFGCVSSSPPRVTEERIYPVEYDKLFNALHRGFLEMENTYFASVDNETGQIEARRQLGWGPASDYFRVYKCVITVRNKKETAVTISIWDSGGSSYKEGYRRKITIWDELEKWLKEEGYLSIP